MAGPWRARGGSRECGSLWRTLDQGLYVIKPYRKSGDGRGWEGDPSKNERVSGDEKAVDQRMVQLLALAPEIG